MKTSSDAALILWNADVIQIVSWVLHQRQIKSCGLEPSEGRERMEDLIVSSGATVVVIDLEPPYDRSAALAMHLLLRFPDRYFVMTCADRVLAIKCAPWLSKFSLFQKPYDVDVVADTVRAMVEKASRTAVLSIRACTATFNTETAPRDTC